jgi:hypothetical protein
MPSRDEPFGYVDIEFAWFGAAIIGALRGGLAKLPGFYYVILNAGSTTHIEDALKKAISAAMACDNEVLQQMSLNARRSSFPVDAWREELRQVYSLAMQSFKAQRARKQWKGSAVAQPESSRTDSKTEPLLGTLGIQPRTMQKPMLGKTLPTIASLGTMQDLLGDQLPDDTPKGDELPCGDGSFGHDAVAMGLGDFEQNTMLLGLPGADSRDHDADTISLISVETGQENTRRRGRILTGRDSSGGNFSDDGGSSLTHSELGIHLDIRVNLFDDGEFLTQEPNEEAVQGFVEAKAAITSFTKQATKSSEELLDETLWELQIAKEINKVVRFFGKSSWGNIIVIDWLISTLYVFGPIVCASFMYFVTLPDEARVSAQILSNRQLWASSISTMCWTVASVYIAPHRMMACAGFSRLLILVIPLFQNYSTAVAVALGFVSSADTVFVYFNFMGRSVMEISSLALRIGMVMAVHRANQWLAWGLGQSPDGVRVTAVVLSAIMSVLIPLAILRAPMCYREFRLPNLIPQFRRLIRVKVLLCLGLSSVVQGFSYAPANIITVWRELSRETYVEYEFVCFCCALVGPICFCVVLRHLPNSAMILVKAFACFSFPCALMKQIPTVDNIHTLLNVKTIALDFGAIVALVMESVSFLATVMAVQGTAGSRWIFVAYTAVVSTLTGMAQALSWNLLGVINGDLDWNLPGAVQSTENANAILTAAIWPSIVAFLAGIAAFFYYDKENSTILWTRRMSKLVREVERSRKVS